MKGFFYSLVVVFNLVFAENSFAKEMSPGEMRFINLNSAQVMSVHFREIKGRTCLVLIRDIRDGKEVFSENISFDQHREDRNVFIGKNKITFFYISKGLTVLLNDEEV